MEYDIKGIPLSEEAYNDYRRKRKKRRNIILLVVVFKVIIAIAAILFFYFTAKNVVKDTNVLVEAHEAVYDNEKVVTATGGIVKVNIMNSTIDIDAFSGDAEFDIEVVGKEKNVNVHLHLSQTHDGWEADEILIEE
jgi:flagellar basal body-associated protein FliL